VAEFGACATCGHDALRHNGHGVALCTGWGCTCTVYVEKTEKPKMKPWEDVFRAGVIVQEPTTVISMEKPIILRRNRPMTDDEGRALAQQIGAKTTYPVIVIDCTWEVIQ